MKIADACLIRSTELSKIIAGCVGINPVKVILMLDRLQPQALTDEIARSFILAMRGKLPELQKADNDHQTTIMIDWAITNHCLFDFALWMTEVKDSIVDAENSIRELQGLAIAIHEIESLQDWIKAREDYVNGR